MTMPDPAKPALQVVGDVRPLLTAEEGSPVEVVNPAGRADVLLVCEHAANRIPQTLANLGLDAEALDSHIAWDPGAEPVARMMSATLDAPLILQRFSRLVYDCNRPPEAPSAMPARSETFDIPGNAGLTAAERRARVEEIYAPFCNTITDWLDRSIASGRQPGMVTIHSFTPVFHGHRRLVELGLLHDSDSRLADTMLDLCRNDDDLDVRRNQPYSAKDGVTHTLKLHAIPRGLLNVMIEIRNDLVRDQASQQGIADRLSTLVDQALGQAGPTVEPLKYNASR